MKKRYTTELYNQQFLDYSKEFQQQYLFMDKLVLEKPTHWGC